MEAVFSKAEACLKDDGISGGSYITSEARGLGIRRFEACYLSRK